MFKNSEKGRFWRLTALPTTATARVAHGCPWWLAGLFPLPLLAAVHSLSPSPLLPCTPPLFFSLFFSFLPWFFLSFSFLLFPSFLFSLFFS